MARKRFNGEELTVLKANAAVEVRQGNTWRAATVLDRPALTGDGWALVRVRYEGPTTATVTHGDTFGVGPGNVRPVPE